jgi:hypothetical protein
MRYTDAIGFIVKIDNYDHVVRGGFDALAAQVAQGTGLIVLHGAI